MKMNDYFLFQVKPVDIFLHIIYSTKKNFETKFSLKHG